MKKSYVVTKNIIYGFGAQTILLLLGVVASPFIIHNLGNDAYGLLSLVTVFAGYLALLDLGLGASIIKYLSEYAAKDDTESLQKVISTAMSIYLIIGAVGALLAFILAPILTTSWLKIPEYLVPVAINVIYLTGLGFLINMIVSVLSAVPNALQRMDITSMRNIFFSLLGTGGVVGLLAVGQGLQTVVIWNVVVSVMAAFSFVLIYRKLLPGFSLKPGFDRDIFKKLLRFSGFKLFSNIGGQVVFQIDRVLIGIFQPIAMVTFYTAPLMLVQKGFSFLMNLTTAVFPAISESHSLEDHQRTKDLYLRATKFTIFLMIPFYLLLFILASELMLVWLGQEFALKSATTLQILSAAYFVAALSAPAVTASEAVGKPEIPSFFAMLSAAINLIAALILVPRFGIEGAAWAMFINFALQVPLFVLVVNRRVMKISHLELLKYSYFKPIISGLGATILTFIVINTITFPVWKIAFAVLAFSSTYLVINYLIGTFGIKEKLALVNFYGLVRQYARGGQHG